MANDPELARKLLQVFCGGAGEQQTSVFGTMKDTTPEYSTDPDVLQGANWPQGWQNAIAADDAPFLEDMNSFFYVISYLVKYLYQHGVAEWNNKETYTALKSVVFSNGKLYVAKQSTGADNPQDPATDSSNTYWYLALDPVNTPAAQNWVIGYAQSLANLSQTIDSSTEKYPSNNAVQSAIANIDLSTKANVALDNVSPAQSFKDMAISWGIPDYSREQSLSQGLFVPPANGVVEIYGGYNANLGFQMTRDTSGDFSKEILRGAQSGAAEIYNGGQAIVEKGRAYYFTGTFAHLERAAFIPFKGEN